MGAKFISAAAMKASWSPKDIKWPKQKQIIDDLLEQPGMSDIVPATGMGRPPKLVNIDKSLLFIEPTYQRLLNTRASLKLIRTMIEGWNWDNFVPPRVSPKDDGTYAVIDGGHTTRAAWLIPAITELPCLIGEKKTIAEQAAAFITMNTSRVNVTGLTLFHAACAAGEPDAVAAKQAAEKAGVTILSAPVPVRSMDIGETVAFKAIQVCVRTHGAEPTTIALRALREAWVEPGRLKGDFISAATQVVRRVQDADEGFDFGRFIRVLRAKSMQQQHAETARLTMRTGATGTQAWFIYWRQQYDKAK
ncbi:MULTISPECIES: DUF6551 family protein [unclassified Azospirillum]|uniref:DUF6551 family protein n=1 Tax=unclassified Azospirillum TaxID=2630922 RepID=UPI0011B28874|nr:MULTISPECIES: DUF6551 family protein [unclassified Azospirillum]